LARRHRELVAAYTRDLCGAEELTAAELSLVERAATVAMKAEQLQAALLDGAAVEVNDLVRLSNSATRILFKTTARYAHVLDEEVAAAMERVAKSRKKSRTPLQEVG
jgi:hypothetical protein